MRAQISNLTLCNFCLEDLKAEVDDFFDNTKTQCHVWRNLLSPRLLHLYSQLLKSYEEGCKKVASCCHVAHLTASCLSALAGYLEQVELSLSCLQAGTEKPDMPGAACGVFVDRILSQYFEVRTFPILRGPNSHCEVD